MRRGIFISSAVWGGCNGTGRKAGAFFSIDLLINKSAKIKILKKLL
jgi:hypothetical protein